MSSRFPTLCLAVFLTVGAFVSSTFGQSPPSEFTEADLADQKRRLDEIYLALQNEINEAYPNSHITLTLKGDKLIVSGTVMTSKEADKILSLLRPGTSGPTGAAASSPKADDHLINQLTILKPLPTGGVVGGIYFVPDSSKTLPEARIRAVFEKAAEARKAGKTEAARAYCETICCLYPESKYAKEATRLLEEMKEPKIPESNLRFERINGLTGP